MIPARVRLLIATMLLLAAVITTLLFIAPATIEDRVRWTAVGFVALGLLAIVMCIFRASLPPSGASVGFAFATARATIACIYATGTIALAGCAWAGLPFAWLLPLELGWIGLAIGIDAVLDRAGHHGQQAETQQDQAKTRVMQANDRRG